MRGKTLLLILLNSFILLFFVTNKCLGANPIISSISGVFSNDQIITVSGSNFGPIPAYTYREFNDTWDAEYSINTNTAEVDLGQFESIHWHRDLERERADGKTVDLLGITRTSGISHYSTGYSIRQGFYYVSDISACFENVFKGVLSNTESELYFIWYGKYGDNVTAWPNPYRETGSGKIGYIYLNLPSGTGNRHLVPKVSTTVSGDSPFSVSEQFIAGKGTDITVPFIRGLWVKFKVRIKLNTWTSWINVSNISRNSNVVTIDTAIPHGLATNDYINVKNCSTSSFNTVAAYSTAPNKITVVDEDTFTYSQTGTNESDTDGEICGAKQDGVLEMWVNDTKIWDGNNVVVEDYPNNNTISTLHLGANHSGNGVAGTCDQPDIANRGGCLCDWLIDGVEVYRYWDDIIISTTDPGTYGIPFIYLSNQSTYGAGPTDKLNGDSNFIRQVVGGSDSADYGFKSWSDISSKFEVNKGTLSGNIYLYVTNWSGETNANGYLMGNIANIGLTGGPHSLSIGGGTTTININP